MKYNFLIYILLFLAIIFNEFINADISNIQEDFDNQKINLTQKYYYQLLGLFDSEKLPLEYRKEISPSKCGFPLIQEIRQNMDQLTDPVYLSKINEILYRPNQLDRSLISQSGLFMIHYTLDGANKVDSADIDSDSIPDYVEHVAEIFDSVYLLIVDSLGYHSFKKDQDEIFDVYLLRMNDMYGYTDWDEYNCQKCTPFIVLSTDYSGSNFYTHGMDAVRVTAAHEFFHAIQLNYRWDSNYIYWYEFSSVWMEDFAYPDVNDYVNYIGIFFRDPNTPLNENNYSMYGKALWNYFVAKQYSPDIVKTCWEYYEQNSGDPIAIFDQLIPGGFDYNFQLFSLWNTYVDSSCDTLSYYSDGRLYPQMKADSTLLDTSLSLTISNLGTKYYHIDTDTVKNLFFEFNDFSIGEITILIKDRENNLYQFQDIDLSVDSTVLIELDFETDEILLGFINSHRSRVFESECVISYQPEPVTGADELDFIRQNALNVYPNPVQDILYIDFDLPGQQFVQIELYDLMGRKISTLLQNNLSGGEHHWCFNFNQPSFNEIASGVYFIQFRYRNGIRTKKIILLRN